METERITLSHRERDQLKVLHEVKQKHLSQVAAAVRLKVSDRQVRRMLLRIGERGDGAVVHGLRGRPSKRSLSPAAPLPSTPATIRKSFRPTASRTCGKNTETQKQNQTQIPCACRSPLEKTLEADISIRRKTRHFYFALTRHGPTRSGPFEF